MRTIPATNPATGDIKADIYTDIAHRNTNDNYGFFGSVEYDVSPRFNLRAGMRYSHDKKRDIIDGYSPVLTAGLVLPISARITGADVTWDVSGTYKLSPTVNAYARVATGYLGPAIQDRVLFGSFQSTAPKQTTISAEAGFKGSLLDRRIDFAIDGYWNKTKRLQITAVGGATNSAQLVSAKEVLGYGFEGELSARPTDNLSLSASLSYNSIKINDPNLLVASCGAACTMIDPTVAVGGAVLARVDGNQLPQAPRWTGNVSLDYEVPLANGGAVFAGTDWSYRSSINLFLYEAVEFTGRPMIEGGAKIGYRTGDGLELTGFVRNITNRYWVTGAIDFDNLTAMITQPRVFGVMARKVF